MTIASDRYDVGRTFCAFVIRVEQTFPMSEGPQAHHLSQQGHVAGKLVVTLP